MHFYVFCFRIFLLYLKNLYLWQKNMKNNSLFTSVVFAGGGSRCLWQVGFWAVVAPALNLAPKIVSGVSAGATMACTVLCDRVGPAMEFMKEATGANHKNAYPKNVFTRRPVFPHYEILRRALLTVFDQTALERLHGGPDIRILLARPPRWTGPRSAVFFGFFCYALEKRIRDSVHPELAQRAGFKAEVVSVRECPTPEVLADLLMASSCTPPFLPVMFWNSHTVLDGGLVDNVPVGALGADSEPTLVLLTRRYALERLPRTRGRLYVQPSEPISIYKWDYTSPDGLQAAYDLGRRDGERFAALVDTMGI